MYFAEAEIQCPAIYEKDYTLSSASTKVGTFVTLTCKWNLLFSNGRKEMVTKCVQVVRRNFLEGTWTPSPGECKGNYLTLPLLHLSRAPDVSWQRDSLESLVFSCHGYFQHGARHFHCMLMETRRTAPTPSRQTLL